MGIITFVSSMHSASVEVIQKRPKGGSEREPIPCPSVIVELHYRPIIVLSFSHSAQNRKVVGKVFLEIGRPFNTEFYSFLPEPSRQWNHIRQSVSYSTWKRDDKTTVPCKS